MRSVGAIAKDFSVEGKGKEGVQAGSTQRLHAQWIAIVTASSAALPLSRGREQVSRKGFVPQAASV